VLSRNDLITHTLSALTKVKDLDNYSDLDYMLMNRNGISSSCADGQWSVYCAVVSIFVSIFYELLRLTVSAFQSHLFCMN